MTQEVDLNPVATVVHDANYPVTGDRQFRYTMEYRDVGTLGTRESADFSRASFSV